MGDWKNNKKNGFGVLYYSNGNRYEVFVFRKKIILQFNRELGRRIGVAGRERCGSTMGRKCMCYLLYFPKITQTPKGIHWRLGQWQKVRQGLQFFQKRRPLRWVINYSLFEWDNAGIEKRIFHMVRVEWFSATEKYTKAFFSKEKEMATGC